MKTTNDNLYKYQIEALQEINNIPVKLERKTNEQYLIKIGEYQHVYFYNNWCKSTGNLYIAINYDDPFLLKDNLTGETQTINLYHLLNWNLKLKLSKNIFLNINKTIDKILKDNKEREAFYFKLNNQLKAINNSL